MSDFGCKHGHLVDTCTACQDEFVLAGLRQRVEDLRAANARIEGETREKTQHEIAEWMRNEAESAKADGQMGEYETLYETAGQIERGEWRKK